jgi:osmotically-inducible protein OsmY
MRRLRAAFRGKAALQVTGRIGKEERVMTKASPTEAGSPQEEVLRKRIIEQLEWDPRVSAKDVKVAVDESMAILTGTVPNLRARIAATDAAWSVWGITAVRNNLRLAPLERIGDPIIKLRVEDALKGDPYFDGTDIKVSVDAGAVTLRGTVDAFWKKGLAQTLVEADRDVVEVKNEIAVVPSKRFTDELIAKDIMGTLERSASVKAEAVNVSVSGGSVTLTGEVPSWTAKRAAQDAAWYTPGVTEVSDRLTVRYKPGRT